MIENVTQWVSLAVTAVTTVTSIVLYFKSRSKAKTISDYDSELSAYKNTVELAKIVQKIPNIINKAEELFPTTGDTKYGPAKLDYVLKEIQILCIKNSVEYVEDAFKYEVEQILSTPQKEVKPCVENV